MANGSRHSLHIIPEVAYGTTPATPALTRVRHNTCTIGTQKDSIMSEELRSDRQIVDFRLGQNKVGGAITTEASLDPQLMNMIEATLGGTWATNVLKAGTTRRSFSMLRYFEDLGASEKAYNLIKGVEFASMNIKVSTGKIGAITLETIAQDCGFSTTAPTGATFGAAGVLPVMDAFTGSVQEGGSAIAVVTEIDLKIDNGLDRRYVIGSKNTLLPQQGRSNVSGTMTCYFESSAMLDKFINESSSSLLFTLSAGASSLQVNLPNIKYTGGSPDVSGEGAILLTMPFQAVYSSGSSSQIVLTRVP